MSFKSAIVSLGLGGITGHLLIDAIITSTPLDFIMLALAIVTSAIWLLYGECKE